jgi:hypothetical protein
MTRIFTDGAEMADLLFWTSTSGGGISSTTKASGDFAYYIGENLTFTKVISPLSELYFRARVSRTNITYPQNFQIPSFLSNTTTIATVSFNIFNQWQLLIGGSAVATSLEYYVVNTFYCIEVYLKIADAPNGRFDLKIDGNLLLSFTGNTKPGANTTVNNIKYVAGPGLTMIDDLGLNDTDNSDGKNDNSWLGGGRVIKLTPNGEGSVINAWDGSDGNKVRNDQMVDEYPSDGDTTYVSTDGNTPGTIDQYSLSDYDGTLKTIERIWAECRARKTSADPATLKIGFDTGTSVHTDAISILYETYSYRGVSSDYKVNPDDSQPWEESDLDILEFVAESG